MATKFTLFFILATLLVYACKKDNDSGADSIAPIPIQLDSFPLAIGKSWKYHTEVTILDSNGQISISYLYDHYWKVISDTIINGWNVTKIQQIDSNYNGSTSIGYTYYANRPDGLYGVAVENFGAMLDLKASCFNLFPVNGVIFNSKTDSIFIPLSPIKYLSFPSNLNNTWDVLTNIDTTILNQNRFYTNFQTVNTAAGVFNCIRLKANQKVNGFLDTNFTIYQDIATKGLIGESRYANLLFGGGGTGKLIQTTRLVQINF